MIYNSNTGAAQYRASNFQESSSRISSNVAGQNYRFGYGGFTGGANARTTIYNFNMNSSPYMRHLSIIKHPNVSYGPMKHLNEFGFIGEQPAPSIGGLNAYAEAQQNTRYVVKA